MREKWEMFCRRGVILLLSAVILSSQGVQFVNAEDFFSTKLEALLHRKLSILEHVLAEDPLVIQAVREGNDQNKAISLKEVLRLDDQWREAKEMDSFSGSFLANPLAGKLMSFQEEYEGFAEIFITDKRGLILALTNKTSDYYQADEDWWLQAYDAGKGNAYYSEIEFDDSALSEVISFYVPVRDPETKGAIGVIKSVFSLNDLKREL